MANRVDSKMVELGLAQSRERARALIIEGVVLLDGVRVMKPSDTIRDGQILSLKENPIPFVSRGGLKLQKAIDTYQISLKDRVCVDIGASTGGFTDCMLMHGAKKVFAVDVGYGQLDWKLRNDERVVCMERHNARFMNLDWFDEQPSFAELSFHQSQDRKAISNFSCISAMRRMRPNAAWAKQSLRKRLKKR